MFKSQYFYSIILIFINVLLKITTYLVTSNLKKIVNLNTIVCFETIIKNTFFFQPEGWFTTSILHSNRLLAFSLSS